MIVNSRIPMSGQRRVGWALVVAMILIATPAYAHTTSISAVDSSTSPPEIRYTDGTQWNTALSHAIAAWTGLPGGVAIYPDTIWTINDLEVTDYSSSGSGYCGYYLWNVAADNLKLNNAYMSGFSSSQRKACMTHEWGHAHGLKHSYVTQVMDACPTCSNPTVYTTAQSHDKVDYDAKW